MGKQDHYSGISVRKVYANEMWGEIYSLVTQSPAQQQEPSDLEPELASGMTAMLRVWAQAKQGSLISQGIPG